MRHIKTFHIFESKDVYDTLYDACSDYLEGTEIWSQMKDKVRKTNPRLTIKEDQELNIDVDAQFDYEESTKDNLVVIINPNHPYDKGYKITMAHELTHALQFLRDGYLDLFTNDATREFKELSSDEEWQKLMMAIYLSDPIEIEASQSELKYTKSNFIEYMSQWMKEFSPEESANRFKMLLPVVGNQFDLESFDEFPDLWSSVYINYGVETPDQEIIDLKNKTLEEFLQYYDKRFKKYPL
jgi:hypothetical protein